MKYCAFIATNNITVNYPTYSTVVEHMEAHSMTVLEYNSEVLEYFNVMLVYTFTSALLRVAYSTF